MNGVSAIKLLSALLTISIISIPTLFVDSVSASEVLVNIAPQRVEVSPGELFELSVRVNPGSYGISGGEVIVSFDPKWFTIIEVEAGDLFGPNPLIGVRDVDEVNGIIRCAIARVGKTTPPTPEGTFITIKFKAREEASPGDYEIRIVKIGLADEKFEDIPKAGIKLMNGEVIIKSAPGTTAVLNTMPTTVETSAEETTTTIPTTTTPTETITPTTITVTSTTISTVTTTIGSTMTETKTFIQYLVSTVTRILERRVIDIFYTVIISGLAVIILISIFLILIRRRRRPRIVGVR